MQGHGFGQFFEFERVHEVLKNELHRLHQLDAGVEGLLHVQEAGAGFAQHGVFAVVAGLTQGLFQLLFLFVGGIGQPLAGKGHAAAQLVQIAGQNDIVPALEQHADNSFRLWPAVAVFLAGALLVGASFAEGLAASLGIPVVPVHHLEGHLLSPLLSRRPPSFPFVALLVSGGHSQLMRVTGVGEYALLGETLDDAAGEAFDKTAKLLGLPYPGGAALSELAQRGRPDVMKFPRPMLHSGDFDFSFSGLKTAVLTKVREIGEPDEQQRADIARGFQDAIVEVLVKKAMRAVKESGLKQLVVAGGVGANRELRTQLDARAARAKISVYYPELEFCTDNGAMIALAGALRFQAGKSIKPAGAFAVRPRWPLAELTRAANG